MKKPTPEERLIVALDVPTAKDAQKWIKKLSPVVKRFKVGMELFTAEGPQTVTAINTAGARVFLDLKFFDIPNTMAGALRSAATLKPFLVNVHALAGPAALARCAQEMKKLKTPPKLLAVTVLTSFSEQELKRIGLGGVDATVTKLCGMALKAGLDGVVASPREAALLRKKFGNDFLIVTPGVRPAWADANDQKRITTPYDAIRNGADYIVVGRPVLDAPDPRETARRIIDEIKEACAWKKKAGRI
ncbi:MAG: orotidine-5'-phosphate decarboxylase [Nitrospinae bacterium]|nr:orotidine-5'-phosphate decarboxylase [Nitrospinota bacterium]